MNRVREESGKKAKSQRKTTRERDGGRIGWGESGEREGDEGGEG